MGENANKQKNKAKTSLTESVFETSLKRTVEIYKTVVRVQLCGDLSFKSKLSFRSNHR